MCVRIFDVTPQNKFFCHLNWALATTMLSSLNYELAIAKNQTAVHTHDWHN